MATGKKPEPTVSDEVAELRAQFEQMVAAEEKELTAEEKVGKMVERFAKMYKDPFGDHDVLRFKKDNLPPSEDAPEGWKLGWKSPLWRKTRGMRGWIPVAWDDPCFNGKMEDFISVAKELRSEADSSDSIVRVKDLMLCRIDARIAKARALKHIVDDYRRRKAAGSASADGADTSISQSIGVGMEDDHAGRQLERLAGVSLDMPDSKFDTVNKR